MYRSSVENKFGNSNHQLPQLLDTKIRKTHVTDLKIAHLILVPRLGGRAVMFPSAPLYLRVQRRYGLRMMLASAPLPQAVVKCKQTSARCRQSDMTALNVATFNELKHSCRTIRYRRKDWAYGSRGF